MSVRVFICALLTADWKVYEDSVELQSFFIRQRDELCRRGEVLLTPALNYTAEQFADMIEDKRCEQTSREQRDDEDRKKLTAGAAAVVKPSSAQVCHDCWYLHVMWACNDTGANPPDFIGRLPNLRSKYEFPIW